MTWYVHVKYTKADLPAFTIACAPLTLRLVTYNKHVNFDWA